MNKFFSLLTFIIIQLHLLAIEHDANYEFLKCSDLYENLRKYNEGRKRIGFDYSKNHLSFLLTQCKELNCAYSEAYAYEAIGSYYFGKGNLIKSLSSLNISKQKFTSLKRDRELARVENKIAIIYTQMGFYNKALVSIMSAKERLKNKHLEKTRQMAEIYTNLATICIEKRDLSEAKYYLFLALNIFYSQGDIFAASDVHNNLGMLYFNRLNEPKKARYFFKKAFYIKKKYNLNSLAITSYNLGYLAMVNDNNYTLAEFYFNQARQIGQKKMDLYYLGISNQALGEIYFEKKDYPKANFFFCEAIKSERQANTLAELSISYESLSKLYEKLNNFKAALYFNKKSESLTNRVSSAEAMKEFVRLKTKYTFLEKDKKIQLLKRDSQIADLRIRRQQNYLLFSIILFLFLLSGTYFHIKGKHRRNELDLERRMALTGMKALSSQLNSHFIANTLVSVKNFLFRKDTEKTLHLIDKFSLLIRDTLVHSRQDIISLQEDMDMLRTYLDLEKVNHSEKFRYEILVSDHLNLATIQIPPMLIQPFIENAIKHGIHNTEDGKISINYLVNNKTELVIRIMDNGKGTEIVNELPRTIGEGTKIILERLTIFNRFRSNPAKLSFSIPPTGGTIVDLIIPLD
jgi:tetratricopeptide (TPR) repeat protein